MPQRHAERYLKEADRCLKEAQAEKDPKIRQQWETLARTYQNMAASAAAEAAKKSGR
jgi:hypothetical protein